jgi:pilus assembly protein CpaB
VNVIVTMIFVDLDNDFQTVLPNRNTGMIAPGTGTGTIAGSATPTEGGGGPAGEAGAQFETSSIVAVTGGGGGLVGRATTDPVLGQTLYHVPSEQQRPRLVSQNLLQDAVVLQVGNFPYKEQEEAEKKQAQQQGEDGAVQTAEGEQQQAPATPPPPDVITLIVTPQDAVTLQYLLFNNAQLTLALRAAQDDTRVQTESVTLQFLLQQYNITIPAKLPNGLEPPVRQLIAPSMAGSVTPTPAP